MGCLIGPGFRYGIDIFGSAIKPFLNVQSAAPTADSNSRVHARLGRRANREVVRANGVPRTTDAIPAAATSGLGAGGEETWDFREKSSVGRGRFEARPSCPAAICDPCSPVRPILLPRR